MAILTPHGAQAAHVADAATPIIPAPVLETVVNRTPFIETHYRCMGPRCRFHDVIVIKGTFDLDTHPLTAADEQVPHQIYDEYWDDDQAEISSLKRSDDLELYKPSTDILVVGTARSLEGKPRTEWAGMLRVNSGSKVLIQKILRLTGPRFWKYGLLTGWTLGAPEPATAIPLRYELAYGGYWIDSKEKDAALARQVYTLNPSGSGHFGKSHDTSQDYPGPQISLHNKSIDASNRQYPPGGFGPIARFWQPRLKYAGTYDNKWLKQFNDSAIPDYPDDFDLRFFQSAPHDQITPTHLHGGEEIQLAGLFGDKQGIAAQLPTFGLLATLVNDQNETLQRECKLDTVTVDLDTQKILLLWRLALPHSAGVRHATIEINHHQPINLPTRQHPL